MNPLDPQSKRVYEVGGTAPCLPSGGGQEIKSIQPCIALDGDKLKPREDQRKGGNGFGINEEGAGYAGTGVDRHGVAYCADGGEVASTITRQISEQSGQDNRANAVVQCYENHATDARVRKVDIAPTMGSTHNAQPDNKNPLVVSMAQNTRDEVRIVGDGEIVGALPAEPGMKQQTYVVSTNSNGEDVAATLTRDLAKQTGAQQQNGGGVCPHPPRGRSAR